MTEQEKNILLNQYVGKKPRRMWRVWYNKERDYGSVCIPALEEAKLTAARELKFFNEWEEPTENLCISEPEEYDDWSHAVNYFGSFDACHDLEKMLRPPNQDNWLLWLKYADHILPKITGERVPVHATESQRAEAIGLTLGLWK